VIHSKKIAIVEATLIPFHVQGNVACGIVDRSAIAAATAILDPYLSNAEPGPCQGIVRFGKEAMMRKIVLVSCLALASAAFATAALARHAHHRTHWVQARAPAAESLTTVGTPDCHVQGRLLRAAHHCPPAAVAAAPR
jgi:hypothetical protein